MTTTTLDTKLANFTAFVQSSIDKLSPQDAYTAQQKLNWLKQMSPVEQTMLCAECTKYRTDSAFIDDFFTRMGLRKEIFSAAELNKFTRYVMCFGDLACGNVVEEPVILEPVTPVMPVPAVKASRTISKKKKISA